MNDVPFGGKDSNWTDYGSAKIIVFPVPYDYTATWQKGADLGPETIIQALQASLPWPPARRAYASASGP